MGADGEEFRHRGLVETDAARIDEIVVGDAEPVRHSAVAVHAEHIEPLAAVGLAAPARDAVAAMQIGNDRDALAELEAGALADRLDLAGELVADHPGIGEIGLRALENVQVGAAHAGAPQADQRGSRRDFRLGPLDERQLVRAGAEQGSHRSPVAEI